jgi:hypothetical protein
VVGEELRTSKGQRASRRRASGSVRGERRGRAVLATGLGSVNDAGKETPLDQQRRRKEPARETTTVEEELGMGGRRREMRW